MQEHRGFSALAARFLCTLITSVRIQLGDRTILVTLAEEFNIKNIFSILI